MFSLVGTRKEIGEDLYAEMMRLRHKIFRERLQWNIPSASSDPMLEVDEFDTDDTVYVVISTAADRSAVIACCRLIPVTGKTMLSALWPDVLDNAPAVAGEWELSRFAADRDARQPGLLSAMILHCAYEYAVKHAVTSYVVVSTPPAARVINRMGIKTERLASVDTSIVPSRTRITTEVGALLRSLVMGVEIEQPLAA